jgi:hypothetical protein
MLDQKVINTISGTRSSMTCYLCGATPSEVKDLALVRSKPIRQQFLQYGIASMHQYIRHAEHVLHLAYRRRLNVWQIRGEDAKRTAKEDKDAFRKRLKRRLGLNVDQPRSGGSGSTTDGNTGRKLFAKPEIFAEVTGVDVRYIKKIATLLSAINLNLPLDIPKFSQLCSEAEELYYALYSWYPLPPAVHKLLRHGAAILEACPLPLGAVSEESHEARTKDVRFIKLHHTRRGSQLNSNEDLFRGLWVDSDPVIRGLQPPERRQQRATLTEDLRGLLRNPLQPPPAAAADEDMSSEDDGASSSDDSD